MPPNPRPSPSPHGNQWDTTLSAPCPQLRLDPWTPLLLITSHLTIKSMARSIGPTSNTGNKPSHGPPLPPAGVVTCLSSLRTPAGPFPLQSAPDNHQVVPAKHKLSTSFLIWKIQAAPSLGGNPSQSLTSAPGCFLGLPFPGGHLCHLRASPLPPAVSLACMLQAGAFGPRFSSRSPGKGPDKSLHPALNPVLRGPSAGSLFPQVSVHTQTVLSSPGMHWL